MLEELLEYVQSNGRVCPQPSLWNALWEMLPNRHRKAGDWVPAPPLILGVWWHATVLQKLLRLQEHIEYAAAQGVLSEVNSFLRALPESDWAHVNDFGPPR